MARWGNCDFEQLKRLQRKIEQFQENDLDEFCKECSRELSARLLRKVIKRTPVGQYQSGSGKVGGTLRRGWTGGRKINVASYVQSLPVKKVGTSYEIEIINPVEYSSYVEYGHRQEPGKYVPSIGKSLKKGWVTGKFMLTISEMELQDQADRIIEKKLIKILGEMLDA